MDDTGYSQRGTSLKNHLLGWWQLETLESCKALNSILMTNIHLISANGTLIADPDKAKD